MSEASEAGPVATNKSNPAPPLLDEAAIERAETALRALAERFESWIVDEIVLLTKAHNELKAEGPSEFTVDRFSQRAHDLKGQGSTLNYPYVTKIAELLCRLCEYLPDPSELPMSLVDAHVDAMRAVVRDRIKGERDQVSNAVLDELRHRVQGTLDAWRASANQ